jgi:alginate O-acetyltransferase complex protein AlgI
LIRSGSVAEAFKIIGKIFAFRSNIFFGDTSEVMNSMFHSVIAVFMLLIADITKEYFYEGNPVFEKAGWIAKSVFYAMLITVIIFFGVFDGGQFIYFQY